MKLFSKIVTGVATCGLLAAAHEPGDDCHFSVEIMQLQDGSDSFKDDVSAMKQNAPKLFSTLSNLYPGMKYGLSSFIDKPLPMRGYGMYGGYQMFTQDYCYRSLSAMSSDPIPYQAGISSLRIGSGFDFPENQLEAMMLCALDNKNTGFTPPSTDYDADGRPIVRIILMITDSIPHAPGDAASAVEDYWNYKRTYNDSGASIGGFGSDSFLNEPAVYDKKAYKQLLPLIKKMDAGVKLSKRERAQYKKGLMLVGPFPMKHEIKEHPGDDSVECEHTEYPSADQFLAVLEKQKIFPVVLLASPGDPIVLKEECRKHGLPSDDLPACMQSIWSTIMKKSEKASVVAQLSDDPSHLGMDIAQAISVLTDEVCARAPGNFKMPY